VLTEFYLKNFVLIEESTLEFGDGLNIISGETGAGKSLIATALSIVLGRSRFLKSHLRKGADSTTLTAVFDLPAKFIKDIEKRLELDVSAAADLGLVIERRMSADGKGKTLLNGKPVPVASLKELGEILFDLSAQDEHAYIRDVNHQRDLLDSFSSAGKELRKVSDTFKNLYQTVEKIKGGKALKEKKKAELEIVRHEVEELEALSYDEKNDAEIDKQISFLENSEQLKALCSTAIETLYESDSSLSSALGNIKREAEDFAEFSAEIKEASDLLTEVDSSIDECVRLLRSCGDSADSDPEELEALIERKHALQDCARKHNCELADLPGILEKLVEKEKELSAWEEEEENLGPKAEKFKKDFIKAAGVLRDKRKKGAVKLEKEVKKALSVLGMENADFKIEITPLADAKNSPEEVAGKASSYGADDILYAVKPNKGEAWGSVTDTASGGETTRIMLAVKSALVKANPCDVLFFDEIDAGVGGKVGEAVATQLEKLAKERQVIAITHLPQIASYGNTHLSVRKVTEKGRTRTSVISLSGEDRLSEIAQMIRGGKITETTLNQAREMFDIR
jgi:DNA repair protein RecN (Recombination protein N)